jgi:pentatricopeptide repeat protein
VCAASTATQVKISHEMVASTLRELKTEKKITKQKLLDACQLLEEMANQGQKPSPSLARTLIYVLCSRGFLRKAVRVVKLMLDSTTLLDRATCTFVIETLSNKGAYDYTIQLLDEMKQRGCTPDPDVYYTLTMSLCNQAYGGCVWHHLEKLIQKGFAPTTRYVLPSLIEAAYLQKGADTAVSVLYQVMLRGVQPNMACYNNILTAFKKENRASEALELFLALPHDMKYNLVTYNILLNALGDQGWWRETETLLDSMTERGIVPNIITYRILILVIANNGYADEALQIAEELGRNRFKTDEWCFNPIIARFCSERRLDMVHKCLKSMERWNCHLKEGTYKAIAVLCKEGMVDEAFDILEALRLKQGTMLQSFYDNVLPYLCRKGSTLEALQILTKLAQIGYTPRSWIISLFVIGLCMEGLHEEALNMFEVADKYHMKLDSGNYKKLISRLCKGRRIDLAIAALEKMVMKGYEPTQSMYLDVIEGIGCQGGKDLVKKLLRELNSRGNLSHVNMEKISVKFCLDDFEY